MWQFFAWFFTFRGRPLPRIVRIGFFTVAIGLFIAVLAYTANLFLTLSERSHAPHVHTHHAH